MIVCTWLSDVINEAVAIAGEAGSMSRAEEIALEMWVAFEGRAHPTPQGADEATRRRLGAIRRMVVDRQWIEVDLSAPHDADPVVAFKTIAPQRVAEILRRRVAERRRFEDAYV